MATSEPVNTFAAMPDPGGARSLDELVECLQALKIWGGNPSYEAITGRINAGWIAAGRPEAELARRGTVVDCFKTGRRRVNPDLLVAVVQALHPDTGYVAQWRQALRTVLGETSAAAQVRAQDRLPDDLADFTGRAAELDRLLRARDGRRGDGRVVLATIEGMAGVGKTQLAIRAGHLLTAEQAFDVVLFVGLRGFHPDPAQPPADPGAVLDSFLRLLGVSGQQIPHDLEARSALFRSLMTGRRTLLVLDDAADEEQILPLLPGGTDCLTLVTSRRSLTGVPVAARLAMDVFTADEAVEFLKRTAPDVPVGRDPRALDRVAQRSGYLPLALSLLAAHMRTSAGWTLTDHADRLDERHRGQRLDSGVELALGLSYEHLPAERRRLLRLLSLHPGPDFDHYAAATLAGADLGSAVDGLRELCREHLLHEGPPGRYAMHDLVRVHAAQHAGDEERPADRRAARGRLFDYYLAAAAAAMDALYSADRDRRPRICAPGVAIPPVDDIAQARAWLDNERTNLVATAISATAQGHPRQTILLAATLLRYLISGYFTDASTIFDQARIAAQQAGDSAAEAEALFGLGTVHGRLGRHAAAADYLRGALDLFRQAGSLTGQARALGNLGAVAQRRADYRQAGDCHRQALALFDQAGDSLGAARALNNLGELESRFGRYDLAIEHLRRGLDLHRQIGDQTGEAASLTNLGSVETMRGRYADAAEHHGKALELYRLTAHQSGQAWTLDGIAIAYTGLGRFDDAVVHHRQALELFQQIGERDGEAWALNGLGEAARLAGQRDRAAAHHTAALAVAAETEAFDQVARAHDGLARAHLAAGNLDKARHHWRQALERYTDLGAPEADRIRADLAGLDTPAA